MSAARTTGELQPDRCLYTSVEAREQRNVGVAPRCSARCCCRRPIARPWTLQYRRRTQHISVSEESRRVFLPSAVKIMTSLELRRMGGSGESGSDADEASEDTTLLPGAKASTGGQRGEQSSSGCCDQCVRRCILAAGCTVDERATAEWLLEHDADWRRTDREGKSKSTIPLHLGCILLKITRRYLAASGLHSSQDASDIHNIFADRCAGSRPAAWEQRRGGGARAVGGKGAAPDREGGIARDGQEQLLCLLATEL
eukprot:COSAG06_NODE_7241_length_2574_cov_2.490101_3_plen_256_part_00